MSGRISWSATRASGGRERSAKRSGSSRRGGPHQPARGDPHAGKDWRPTGVLVGEGDHHLTNPRRLPMNRRLLIAGAAVVAVVVVAVLLTTALGGGGGGGV